VKSTPGTWVLILVLLAIFGVEISTHTLGNETALLRLGALPANGQLHGEYWRFITYAFLHLNGAHIIANLALLWWVGRIVERRVGTGRFALLYLLSIVLSGASILFKYVMGPSEGATIGASGGVFGLLGAALVLVYRRDMATFGQDHGLRIGLWICLAVGLAISFVPGVSIAGHIGGLIAGLILGMMVAAKDEPAWFRIRRSPSRT
jgi:membrane associated rhomboid family serine protease